ncbi:unnamed protein product, partial [Ilex paraguariensis]
KSCEAIPSKLHIPDETSSLPIPSVDSKLLLDHAPASADLLTDFETSVPPLEPPTSEVPAISPVISSPPRRADAEPEEHLTKKRWM